MELPICKYCRGQGTGTWCQQCNRPAPSRAPEPERDPVFGEPLPPGRVGAWMQTYSGGECWPRSPRREDIAVEDVAIGLARECRYGKQTLRWYSVAEHSVIVSILVGEVVRGTWHDREEFAVACEQEGLFHDCDEAPLHDMPRPIKHDPEMGFDHYRSIGARYRDVVFDRFNIRPTKESHELIDAIDKRLVVDEVQQCMRRPEMYLARHGHVKPCGVQIQCLEWEPAMVLFLSRFAELFPGELR